MGVLASTLPIDQKGTPALYSDTLANRPAAGFTGRLFVSTDTFALYRDNGTTWDLIGGPGTGTVTSNGTIDAGRVAYGTGVNEIGGNANFLYNAANGLFSVSATNNDSVVRFTQNNPVGYLLALNDGTNDVVIADRFGTIYASAFAAFLTFANVYAGGFVNDDPLGKGLQIQGGSTTTQSFLVTNYDDSVTMIEVFEDRITFGVEVSFVGNNINRLIFLEDTGTSPGTGYIGVDANGVFIGSLTNKAFNVNTASSFSTFTRSNTVITINPSFQGLDVYSQFQSTADLALAAGGDNNALYVFGSNRNIAIGTTVDSGDKLRVNGSGRFVNSLRVVGSGTISVSTSPVVISGSLINDNGGFAIVYGTNVLTEGFSDVVYYSNNAFNVIASQSITGAPPARTYSVSGGILSLQLASDTYNVVFQYIGTPS